MNLLATTLELLKNRPVKLETIAYETNLPYLWLRKISSGKVQDPGVNRIQKLYEYLSGKRLIAG